MLRSIRKMAALLLAVAMSLFGTTALAVECLPSLAPEYGKPRVRTDSVVVFLHGLHGGAHETWTYSPWVGQPIAWPCLVLGDTEVFGTSNVFLASYLTRPGQPNPSIEEAARIVVEDLRTADVFRHSYVTFVAHSMGGIVLARMLTSNDLLDANEVGRIQLAVFLATPALPTEAANICAKFGVNRQCAEMSDAHKMESLWAQWDKLEKRPAVRCVAEGRDMPFLALPPWLRIVPEASAHRPCVASTWQPRNDEADHSELAKPGGTDKASHRHLRTMFHACIKHYRGRSTPSPETLKLTEEVTNWFYGLIEAMQRDEVRYVDTLVAYLSTDVKRYKFPQTPDAPLDARRYEDLNAPSFARALWALRPTLPDLRVRWVRPASDTVDYIGDSAFTGLLRDFESAGAARDSDILLALAMPNDSSRMIVLRIRRGDTGALALLGLVVLPQPGVACR